MNRLLIALLLGLSACGPGERTAPDYTVGVYYYPWHAGNFHGGRYLREHLIPPQAPELGEYDDRDADVIGRHIAWSRDSGIAFWAASWWGPEGREDIALRDHVLVHPELGDLKIAIHYETTGRTKDFTDYSRLREDFEYLARTYFGHPNYLSIDGRPVVYVYLTRVLARRGKLAEAIRAMRAGALDSDFDVYIVGDHVFGKAPKTAAGLDTMDAITNYDVYGSMAAKGYAGQEAVDRYYAEQAKWRDRAREAGVAFVPAVTPGFNDKAVREGHAPVSRKLTHDSEFGTLFRAMLQGAKPLADDTIGKTILVTSWNEWHEDTQIEPVGGALPTSGDDTGTRALSEGLAYEGYGTRYLDILREEIFATAE